MAIRNQQALYELIDDKLNENSYDVDFRVDLYNAGTSKYYTTDDEGQKHRFVPTMITDVVGEYLNVPNANSTSNQVGISFDIFTDYKGELSDKDITELKNVNYTNTLNAVEEFKNSLLAKYFPLGTPYLYMGGEDSHGNFEFTTPHSPKVFYMKFIPYNTDDEELLLLYSTAHRGFIKNATHIRFQYGFNLWIDVPYTVDVEKEVVAYYNGTDWVIEDSEGNSDSATITYLFIDANEYSIGKNLGFEGLIKRASVNNVEITSFDFDNVSSEVADFQLDFNEWNSKSSFTNSGGLTLTENLIENSILWSLDGNAIFGFGTLNPVSNIRPTDGGYYYQEFEIELSVFISNDVLFGNNFEYYLDGLQIFPIDRNITLGTDIGSGQYINSNENEYIVEESAREHTLSFYYMPSKKLTKILKHVTAGSTAQNTTYELIVQYPFFKVTYNVILDSGGTEPNINTLSTFTVTFKRKDASLS